MDCWEAENAKALGMALKEAGFQISQLCCCRPSCFDFVAKKENEAAFVKLHSDVDMFSRFDSRELRIIAGRASAAPLVVSNRTHDKPLEDDTLYSRYSVFVITAKTLTSIAFRSGYPLVNAGPGGYFVEIDGGLLEKRRKELGLSIGMLAAMIGVSRRTLYGYERSMAKASVTSAYNLAKILGVPVAKPVNVFDKTRKQRMCLFLRAKHAIARRTMLQKIFRRLAFSDFSPVRKAPFDFVVSVPKEERIIIGAVATEGEDCLDERIEETVSIARVIDAHPMLITEKNEYFRKDILCLNINELADMQAPLDIASYI